MTREACCACGAVRAGAGATFPEQLSIIYRELTGRGWAWTAYDWDEGRILVNMDFERLRLGHMRRDPRVAVTVIDLDDWYRAVTVLGRVVEIRDDEGLVDIDRLSKRYRGAPYRNRERKRVTALIEPDRWHEHS